MDGAVNFAVVSPTGTMSIQSMCSLAFVNTAPPTPGQSVASCEMMFSLTTWCVDLFLPLTGCFLVLLFKWLIMEGQELTSFKATISSSPPLLGRTLWLVPVKPLMLIYAIKDPLSNRCRKLILLVNVDKIL